MNDVQVLLLKSLNQKNFGLDLQNSRKRILYIASQDLTNYLTFHWKLTGKEVNPSKFESQIHDFLLEKPKEFIEFLNVWTGLWIKKWHERVKFVQETEESLALERTNEALDSIESTWKGLENRQELEDIIVEELVRNGEICGTSILAEHLLKTELISMNKQKTIPDSLEDLLNLTKGALIKASNLSGIKGPAIFIVLDGQDSNESLTNSTGS